MTLIIKKFLFLFPAPDTSTTPSNNNLLGDDVLISTEEIVATPVIPKPTPTPVIPTIPPPAVSENLPPAAVSENPTENQVESLLDDVTVSLESIQPSKWI